MKPQTLHLLGLASQALAMPHESVASTVDKRGFSLGSFLSSVWSKITTVASGSSGSDTTSAPSSSTPTQADLETFAYYAQWAGAAYCNSVNAVGSTVTCNDTVCPTVNAQGATIVATLGTDAYSSETDMLGFVGYDAAVNQIVASFRGSSTIRTYITDLEFALVDCGNYLSADVASQMGSDCRVHEGFGKAWAYLRSETFAAVEAARGISADAATAALVVTGHSLGAAVATLAAAELRAQDMTLDLYTYGSPRVGNEALAAFVSNQGHVGSTSSLGIANYRVTHTDDPVPQLPPVVIGYSHTSPELWLENDGVAATAADAGYFSGEILYTPSDVKVCTGYQSFGCNAGEPSLDVDAHLEYFLHISACDATVLTYRKRDLESLERMYQMSQRDRIMAA